MFDMKKPSNLSQGEWERLCSIEWNIACNGNMCSSDTAMTLKKLKEKAYGKPPEKIYMPSPIDVMKQLKKY